MLHDPTNVNNAVSMICVSDALHALRWVRSIGGLKGCIARTQQNFAAIKTFVNDNKSWVDFLASDESARSTTSVCLTMKLPPKTITQILNELEKKGVAYDIGAYRTAPAGVRIWCGMTVEALDVVILTKWLEYFYKKIHLGSKEAVCPTPVPSCPNFSSGPCKKYPTFDQYYDPNKVLGRSHRHKLCKARTVKASNDILSLLQCPRGYVAAIVTGGCTGAMEAAMWSFLGSRPVDVFCADAVSRNYADTIQKQLRVTHVNVYDGKIDGRVPDYSLANAMNDCVLVWNGTTSGVRVPSADWIAEDREGVVICDATSAVFAMPMPWDKLDVVTFSWQKALGGEAAHGTIILSPRALARLKADKPPRPMPKLYRLKKQVAAFEGDVINTISMLCIEDVIQSLRWGTRNGGLQVLQQRTLDNFSLVARFVQRHSNQIAFVAEDPNSRSATSVVLKVNRPENEVQKILAVFREQSIAKGLEVNGRLQWIRIWCGPSVEAMDIEFFLNHLHAALPIAKL
jgi:phosphoserine aminotransferase